MFKSTCLYARVSTPSQDTLSQWPQLREWAEREGVEADEYEDVGSGKRMSRKGIQSVLHGIRQGFVKRVVTVSLNRFGRNASQVWAFLDECIRHNVQVIAIREKLDLATPFGRSMAQIICVFAELDNEMRSEATRAGLAARKAQAEREGRPWRTGGSTKGFSLKVSAEKAAAILHLRATPSGNKPHHSYRQIAKAVGLSDKTVRQVCLQPRPEYVTRTEAARQRRKGK